MSVVATGGDKNGLITTRVYSLAGVQQWTANQNTGAHPEFENYPIHGIAVDVNDYVYTGGNENIEDNIDAVRKYDADGNQVWSRMHGANVYAVAVDASGNVIGAGQLGGYLIGEEGLEELSEGTVRKWDADGNLLWAAGPGEQVPSVAADASGNIYTASGNATQKLSADGAPLWSANHGAPCLGVAVTPTGILAVAGIGEVDGYTTRRYAADGTLTWSVKHGLAEACVAIDNVGNVYSGGLPDGDGYTTRKHDPDGNVLWSAAHGDIVYGIAVDEEGNVYTVGKEASGITTRKYSADGTPGWTANHGATVYCVATYKPTGSVTPRGAGGGRGPSSWPPSQNVPGGDWGVTPRDFTSPLGYYQGLQLRPTLLSWDAVGGCDRATFRVVAGELELWSLVDLLRCGIKLNDRHGEPWWWGYIHSVTLHLGEYSFGVSLDDLANRVAVAYEYVGAGISSTGVRATTDWAEDLDSEAEFGTFERLESLASADIDDAEARRDALLQALAWPQAQIDFNSAGLSAEIEARGWHRLLERRYYLNENTSDVQTTEQIEDMMTALGEFFTAVVIEDDSGVYSNEFRDGDSNAWEELKALLASGWTDISDYGSDPNTRLLCYVTPERVLRVHREPYPGAEDLRVYPSGEFEDAYGNRLGPGLKLVGRWARLVNFVPPQVSLQPVVNPTRVFIERLEYDVERLRLRPQPRGMSAYQVGGLQPG